MSRTSIRVLPKESLTPWIERMMAVAEVIGPRRGPAGEEVFGTLTDPTDLLWDFVNPLTPPKQFLLPQTEPLAVIRQNGGSVRVEPVHDAEPRIFLNVRNCDFSGLAFLAHVLGDDLPDTAFLGRMGSSTFVTLACTAPCPQGFCVCCGAGPFLEGGPDLQLTDLGDTLLLEAEGEKGLRLLELGEGLHRGAAPVDIERRKALEAESLRAFGEVTCHFGSAMRRVSTRRVAGTLWEAMAPWCLECGGCNLACPTCYCFSVKDRAIHAGGSASPSESGGIPPEAISLPSSAPPKETEGAVWVRSRIWDSCQYEAFTLEASGHNPRALKPERMKRRFYHKVSAQYYQRDGLLGCVGCGRCIQVCMGTTDMPSVVEAIRKGRWEGAEGVREREEACHV